MEVTCNLHHRRISSLSSYDSVFSIKPDVAVEPFLDEIEGTPQKPKASISHPAIAIIATTSPEIKALGIPEYFRDQKEIVPLCHNMPPLLVGLPSHQVQVGGKTAESQQKKPAVEKKDPSNPLIRSNDERIKRQQDTYDSLTLQLRQFDLV